MVKIDKVLGSKEQAKPLVITADVVYLHTDITCVKESIYSYVEYQLTLPEFLETIFEGTDIAAIIQKLEVQN